MLDAFRLMAVGRVEPSPLIKLLVGRQELFRHEADDFAVVEHRRTVVNRVADLHGQTDNYHLAMHVIGDALGGLHGRVEEQLLLEQIAAGVARHAQFREEHDRRTLDVLRSEHLNDFIGIGVRVADMGLGKSGGDADMSEGGRGWRVHFQHLPFSKTVFHRAGNAAKARP